jgi:hypothetical protein
MGPLETLEELRQEMGDLPERFVHALAQAAQENQPDLLPVPAPVPTPTVPETPPNRQAELPEVEERIFHTLRAPEVPVPKISPPPISEVPPAQPSTPQLAPPAAPDFSVPGQGSPATPGVPSTGGLAQVVSLLTRLVEEAEELNQSLAGQRGGRELMEEEPSDHGMATREWPPMPDLGHAPRLR